MLEVQDLCVCYGSVQAVSNVSFEVNKNEIVLLLGPNGGGKSTILNSISGLLKPATGSISFEGERIEGKNSNYIVKKGISQAAEGKRIFPELSVKDNLHLGGFVRWQKNKKKVMRDAEKMYERFPILKKRKKILASSLSGGEQQMLVIAQALMSKPKLILLDEPSHGLAPKIVDEIFQAILELHEEGRTILLVEQRAQQALDICDRGYILETGYIVGGGDKNELKKLNKLKEAYLGTANKANERG